MIDPELLKVLRCPETRQTLRLAENTLVEALNLRIKAGGVKNRGGQVLGEPLEAGLIREDGLYLYPIRRKIPIMLIDEAIALKETQAS